jgi:hypothetical protein
MPLPALLIKSNPVEVALRFAGSPIHPLLAIAIVFTFVADYAGHRTFL